MKRLLSNLLIKTGLALCNYVIPRMRTNPDITLAEYNEAVEFHKKFTKALEKLNATR